MSKFKEKILEILRVLAIMFANGDDPKKQSELAAELDRITKSQDNRWMLALETGANRVTNPPSSLKRRSGSMSGISGIKAQGISQGQRQSQTRANEDSGREI